MKLLVVLIFFIKVYTSLALKGTAQVTYYNSYAPCCKENPNYDPKSPTDECTKYSACKYTGLFAGLSGKQSFSFVKGNNLVAFFDSSDNKNLNWKSKYSGKSIRLTKDGKTFTAKIVDKCGDVDCSGCCTRNAKRGYLVDLEY